MNELNETTIIMIHVVVGHTKPAPLPNDQCVLTPAEQDQLISNKLRCLSRRHGRTWPLYGDMLIGGSKKNFIRCELRNEIMNPDRQEEEVAKNEQILCVGCYRSRNRTPCCVGQMIRQAWHVAHPDNPRFYISKLFSNQ